MTTPLSTAQIIRLGQFLEALKTGLSITSLSDAFDIMYVLGGETSESSLKNLVEDDHHCTLAGTTPPAFVAFEGFAGDGATGYLKTDYIPASDGATFTANDASFGVYSRSNEDLNTGKIAMGSRNLPSNLYDYFWIRTTSNKMSGIINATTAARGLTVTNTYGLYSIHRNSATNCVLAKNAIFGADTTVNVVGVSNREFYILAMNNGGTAGFFETKQISFAWAGKSLTQPELTVLVNALEVYMDANNKGVLPNKVMTILGDSISNGIDTPLDWVNYVPITQYEIKNHAASGNAINYRMDEQTIEAATDDANIIIIALGTNDNNNAGMDTLKAIVEQCISDLRTSNPNATIYYMNILPRWTDETGGTEVDKGNLRAMINEACVSQGIICWDTYDDPWITAEDTLDGLHPSDVGGLKIWSEISSRL